MRFVRTIGALGLFALSACAGRDMATGPSASAPIDVIASRSFSGPTEYPSSSFAGYGIVAFPDLPTRARAEIFCEAFARALLAVQDLEDRGIPQSAQMATVWPISDNRMAFFARNMDWERGCEIGVAYYGLAEAQDAILDARRAGGNTIGNATLTGRGPYLLAWSPGKAKGTVDTLVLIADLSNVESSGQAAAEFRRWRDEIQLRPELWRRGWSLESLRIAIQRWSDQRSASILRLLGAS